MLEVEDDGNTGGSTSLRSKENSQMELGFCSTSSVAIGVRL